jgi:hypothetical protein
MYISVRECIVALLRFKGAHRLNFELNGIRWQIVWVDNKNSLLSRTDGSMSVGVTDMNTHCIYLAKSLHGAFLRKVLIHELCHCVCMSYNIYMPIEQEEMLCDFVATYGDQVFEIVDILTGYMGDRMYG